MEGWKQEIADALAVSKDVAILLFRWKERGR
jgi:hypothetical protein